jgi:glycosyltransferase involved in cell wall biosynthesis
MKKKLIIKGPVLSASGYGEHARFVLRALKKQEDKYDIYLHNLNWGKTSWIFEDNNERQWIDSLIAKTAEYLHKNQGQARFDISLQVTIPNEFEKIAQINVGITAGIETTKVAPEWLQKCNEMDKIVVVSNHAKYGFENTKYPLVNEAKEHVSDLVCNTPIDVVGYPVREIKPTDIELNLATDFNFLTVALWGQRKNMERTVLNFLEEFNEEEVGLILKTSIRGGSTYDKNHTETMLNGLLSRFPNRKCKVYLLHGRMSEEEMTALYQHDKVKCMLSLAHGEGFGLPLFEAAHNGLPIIATDWSGQLDFLYAPQKDKKGKVKNKGLFGKVSYDLGKVQQESVWEGVITPDSMWAFPKDVSAKEKMRSVYKDYTLALGKAKKLKKFVDEEFESEKMHNKLLESIHFPTTEDEILEYV